MNYKIQIEKTLIMDKKRFRVGQDIAFSIVNKENQHHDRYIGEITEITEATISIKHVEINGNEIDCELTIYLSEIESNSCDYVYYD